MAKYNKGYTYTKALRRMGYSNFSLVGINSMLTQEEFQECLIFYDENGNILETVDYPSLNDVKLKANEVALDQAWYEVRQLRNAYLAETDYIVAIANESGTEVPLEWKNYRQALRDITNQDDPSSITWPIHPQGKLVGFNVGYEPPNSAE